MKQYLIYYYNIAYYDFTVRSIEYYNYKEHNFDYNSLDVYYEGRDHSPNNPHKDGEIFGWNNAWWLLIEAKSVSDAIDIFWKKMEEGANK